MADKKGKTVEQTSTKGYPKLGEFLIKEGKITEKQLDQALALQKATGKRLGTVLVDLGYVSEKDIAIALSKQLNIPFLPLSHYELDEEVLKTIPEEVVRKYRVIPVEKIGDNLTVAIADPTDIFVLDELRLITKCNIVPLITLESELNSAIDYYYKKHEDIEEVLRDIKDEKLTEDVSVVSEEEELDLSQMRNLAQEAPVVKLVNALIAEAVRERASDIHIEPYEDTLRVRYRIDGVLHEVSSPPKRLHPAIVSRIKILSQLDIAERRLPQDSRFKVKIEDREIDIRVSIVPTVFGEKVVLRLLDRSSLVLDMKQLGFEQDALELFEETIRKPYGLILVTGPTGSGKTTTLYTALQTINSPTRNILTVEDPVEYELYGVNQVQARPDIGLTFAAALRAFLRQDPDIILVGEIRDIETAEIAIKAALTGHLVFSTLHTNDAPSSITRLIDMGVEPFLVTASLLMIVAQRLARKICPRCKEEYVPSQKLLRALGIDGTVGEVDPSLIPKDLKSLRFYRGRGCNYCNQTGYRGRIGLFEVLSVNEKIREAIIDGASVSTIRKLARENGMRTLRESGIKKVLDGITTVEEVLGVTMAVEE